MARFITVLRRSRFVITPFSPETMQYIGQTVLDSIIGRIRGGLDCNDQAAPPLKGDPSRNGYAYYKRVKFHGLPIRDWYRTGKTIGSMKVISAQNFKTKLGLTTPDADMRVSLNNRVCRQWGLSPKDKAVFMKAIRSVQYVKISSSVGQDFFVGTKVA
jgi:hypothetical protein